MRFAGEREDEPTARGERGARVRVLIPSRVTRAPRLPRALCSPSSSPAKGGVATRHPGASEFKVRNLI